MEIVKTGFIPQTHGFPFQNCFDLHDFFQSMLPHVQSGQASLGNPVYGLCGGMCFAALDHYFAQTPHPQNTKTEEIPWPYFLYLWQRQLHSLKRSVILKIFEWMLTDDLNLARKIARYEIPKILSRIKEGNPVVLVLIRVQGITDPTKNHQVLVIGYELDTQNKDLKLLLYDPNYPNHQPEMKVNLSNPNQGLALAYSTGDPLRGFFALDYSKQAPPDSLNNDR
jgi:hypothetical protein